MIEVRNLTRRYGAMTAVNDVSLSIERGQIVGLLGHNGAGKTTMMKMMTGFLEPSEGTVTLDGRDVVENRDYVQRRIGYLPESAPLYPEMLVQEYLATMAELRGIPGNKVKDAVLRAADATGLTERLLQPISTLSKGFRQRVGLAQAIVHGPDVLILDEPTNGLDPTQIRQIRDLILKLGESTTVLLSTHILQEIEAVCSRVIVLISGKVAADASLEELVGNRGLIVRAQGGVDLKATLSSVPGITAVSGEFDGNGLSEWKLEYEQTAPIESVVDALRAQHATLLSIGPERRTLEDVFRELEDAHSRGRVAA